MRPLALVSWVAVGLAFVPAVVAAPPRPRLAETDQQRAKAIGLSVADLGLAWTDNLKTTSPAAIDVSTFGAGGGGGIACGGGTSSGKPSSGHATAGAVSDFVTGGGREVVYSIVILFKTKAEARADWRKATSGSITKCLASAFLANVSSPSWKTALVSSGRRKFETGVPLAAAFRVVVKITTTARVLAAYYDAFLQTGSRAETATTITSYGSPPAAALERQLVRTLAGRLQS